MSIEFADRTFCFTGTLSDLKRTAAERETRARGGLTQDRINDRLDYLVIGSIASRGWAHGSYGRKIESARSLIKEGSPLRLIPEVDFVAALAATPTSNSGAVDGKVVVANYHFTTPDESSIDLISLEHWLSELQDLGAHVSVKVMPALTLVDLFDGDIGLDTSYLVVDVRIVRQCEIDFDVHGWTNLVARGFEAVRGVDGRLGVFERREGSADYVRLLREIPQSVRLPGV